LSFAQFEAEWRSVPLERMRSSCGICSHIGLDENSAMSCGMGMRR